MKSILTLAIALVAAGGGYAFYADSEGGLNLPCCPAEDVVEVTTVSTVAAVADAGCCAVKATEACTEPCDPTACEPSGCEGDEIEGAQAGEYAMMGSAVLASPADAAACSSAKAECSEAKAECSEAAKAECTEAKAECSEAKACSSKTNLD